MLLSTLVFKVQLHKIIIFFSLFLAQFFLAAAWLDVRIIPVRLEKKIAEASPQNAEHIRMNFWLCSGQEQEGLDQMVEC